MALFLVLTLLITAVSVVVGTANQEKGVDMMDAILNDETLAQYRQGDTQTIANDGYIGIPVDITTYYDSSKPTKSGNEVDSTNLVIYVVNIEFDRIGTDSDVDIIKSMIDRGYIVTVVDYKYNSKAVSPDLAFSLQSVRNAVVTGRYFTDTTVFEAGSYYNSFVVPSGYNVSPHHVFWEIDKHGTDGTFDKIVEYWNNDFRAWSTNKDRVVIWVDENGNRKATQTAHDGTSPVWLNADGSVNPDGEYIKIKHTKAEKITDCIRKDGRPIDLNLYMHLIYPTGSAEVPVLSLVGSSEHIGKGSSTADRPQFIGATLRGYAAVTFDHGWTPMARADHYGYFDGSTPASGSVSGNNTTYSIQFYNEVEIATAAMRYIRYLSLSEEKFNFKLDSIAAYGNSKGGWMQFLGAEDPYTASGERRVYIGHHGETRYDNGDTETVGIIDGGEPQPWLTYNGVEIDGGADFVYCSCGGTSESILPGHAPVFISCQLDDGSCWGSSREFIMSCRASDIPAMWVEVSLGHTFASGPDTKFGIQDTYSTFFNFLGYWMKDDAVKVEYIHADMTYGGMPTYAPFVVKFTGSVSESELSKITLVAADGTVANGRWEAAFGNTEWTFYPDYLKSNMEYTMTVPAGVVAANGKAMENDATYSVTTGFESADPLTLVTGTRGTYASFTVPSAGSVTAFNVNKYLLRIKVAGDAVNKLGIYVVTGFNPASPDGSTVGNLLGSVPVNGAGYYEIDLTEYMDTLAVGTQATLLVKAEKTAGNTTLFSWDGTGNRPSAIGVSGTVESSVTTLEDNGVLEIGKTKPTATYPLDPFYNNLSYNTVINATGIIKAGNLSYDDIGRRITVSFRVYDTTSRILQIFVKDASNRANNVLDYNGTVYSVTTKANEWTHVSFTQDIYDPAEFGDYGLINKSVAIRTYGFGEVVHPIYFDDFKSVETVTTVDIEEISLVCSTTEQRKNPLETPYGTIPTMYESVEDYPFVVFDSEGNFIRATDVWATDMGTGALGAGQKQSYVNYIILLRRDYHYDDTTPYNNFAFCYGDFKLDLDGHKFYLEQSHAEGLFYCHAKRSPRTDVVIENGEIVFNGGKLITIGAWDNANYDYKNEVKQFNFTFNGVTFSHGESSAVGASLFMNAGTGAAVPVMSNVLFNECIFDFESNLPSGYKMMQLGTANDNVLAHVTVKGGEIRGGDLSDLYFYDKVGVSCTFEFEKGEDNKYFIQKIKDGGKPASISVEIEGTNYSYAESGTEGAYTVYTVAKNPLETPYGLIDSAYADETKYPFVLFKDNGDGTYTFVRGEESIFQDASKIMLELRNYSGVIYMRRDYTVERSFNNTTYIQHGMTLDLGNNVLTSCSSGSTYVGNLKKAWSNEMTFINGDIVLPSGNRSFIGGVCATNTDGKGKSMNVTFKNVNFVWSTGAYGLPIAYQDVTNKYEIYSNVLYDNCTFDLTVAGGVALFNTGYDFGHVTMTVRGGKITKGSSLLILTQLTSNGTVIMEKGDDGYLTIEVNEGASAPSGIFTYDGKDGSMVYAKTQSGKDIYVVGDVPKPVETPYGTIPAEYSNANVFPFVVFKANGTFFGAYPALFGNTDKNTGGDLSLIAMHGARSAGDGAVILMMADWTYTDNISYPNIGNNVGTVTLDLNGFTIYDKHTYSGGLFILRSKSTPTESTLVVKNGNILIGGKNSVVSCIEHSTSITDTVLNLIFDGVTFGYTEGGTSNVVLVRDYRPTNNLGYNITVKNSTVDMTNAPAGAKIFELGTGVVNVDVENMKVIGENNVDGTIVNPKHSVTLYSDFLYTVYIPTLGTIEYIELDGVRYTDLGALEIAILADGNSYYKLQKRINPFGAYESISLSVGIKAAGESSVCEWNIGVIEYIKTVVNDTDTTNSQLAKDMLSYIAAAYNFFAPTSAEAANVTKLATEILGAGYDAENMPTPAEKVQSTNGLDSAALMIDGAPAFVFYPETDADGNLVYSADRYSFAVGGSAVKGEVLVDGNGRTYIAVRVSAYRMLENVTYTVSGTDISGEYNLSAYLEFASAESDALETLVLRLMKYCESADAYRIKNS